MSYFGHKNAITALAWSPDGTKVASASRDATVQIWQISPHPGKEVATYRGHNTWVTAIAWSPDGKRLASVEADKTGVHLWQAGNANPIYIYKSHQAVETLALSPDGIRVASIIGAEGMIEVWQAGLSIVPRHPQPVVTPLPVPTILPEAKISEFSMLAELCLFVGLLLSFASLFPKRFGPSLLAEIFWIAGVVTFNMALVASGLSLLERHRSGGRSILLTTAGR